VRFGEWPLPMPRSDRIIAWAAFLNENARPSGRAFDRSAPPILAAALVMLSLVMPPGFRWRDIARDRAIERRSVMRQRLRLIGQRRVGRYRRWRWRVAIRKRRDEHRSNKPFHGSRSFCENAAVIRGRGADRRTMPPPLLPALGAFGDSPPRLALLTPR